MYLFRPPKSLASQHTDLIYFYVFCFSFVCYFVSLYLSFPSFFYPYWRLASRHARWHAISFAFTLHCNYGGCPARIQLLCHHVVCHCSK